MMDSKEFLVDEKDCAKVLGMTLSEYRAYLKTVKPLDITEFEEEESDEKDSFLEYLGLTEDILKKAS